MARKTKTWAKKAGEWRRGAPGTPAMAWLRERTFPDVYGLGWVKDDKQIVIPSMRVGTYIDRRNRVRFMGGYDRLRWTGLWPGEAEAIKYRWYARLTRRGWRSCRPDAPGALPDLNRVRREMAWNHEEKRFVRKRPKSRIA